MADHTPPQPHPDRIADFGGRPVVVGVVPGQPPVVALTALSLARATGAPCLYFGYVDTDRFAEQEFADGTVRHAPISPDDVGDDWLQTRDALRAQVSAVVGDFPWELRYLAGRPDRALTHLARAVDASCFVIGTRRGARRMHDLLGGSVSMRLSHHQHRPVLVVPLEVVDWSGKLPWE
ncbi:universal stress protein [Calidifontibacter terrae]